jgi:hypothetical protein
MNIEAMKRSARDLLAVINDRHCFGRSNREPLAVLADKAGVSERTARRALRDIEAAGLVIVTRRNGTALDIKLATPAKLAAVDTQPPTDETSTHETAPLSPPPHRRSKRRRAYDRRGGSQRGNRANPGRT